MAKKNTKSQNCAGGCLFVMILIVIVGKFLSGPTDWEKTSGAVKAIEVRGKTKVEVRYSYLGNGKRYSGSEIVPRSRFPMSRTNQRVGVYYDKDMPSRSHLAKRGFFQTIKDELMSHFLFVLVIPIVLGFLGLKGKRKS